MDASEWIEREIAALVAEFGAVPPPWVLFPDTHPYDIGWRMGDGEAHIEVFGAWWDREKAQLDESDRIDYFRQWPPPPCWLKWMIDVVWNLCAWELPESFDYSAYFDRVAALGFGTQADYQPDLADPRWYAQYEEDESE